MNDRRIDFMLKTDPFTNSIWKGFLAPDVVLSGNQQSSSPQLYIVNNAPTYLGGEHWCALIIFKSCCEFFDPLGRSPIENGVFHILSSHCKKIKFNNVQYQASSAKTCGHHCIFFAMQRARGISCKKIKQMYHKTNLTQNDDLVFNFVVKHFGVFMARIQDE